MSRMMEGWICSSRRERERERERCMEIVGEEEGREGKMSEIEKGK